MALLDTTNWGVAGEADAQTKDKPPAKTGFIDGVKATWDQEGIWTTSRIKNVVEYPNDTTFDYKSYEQKYWPLVAEARNREHAEDMVAQYEREQKNREIMENQSFALGLGTNFVVGLTNPFNYIGVGRGVTWAGAALKGAAGAVAGTAATEVVLQDRQLTRTAAESLYNIAGAAVIGAPLGVAGKAVENRLARGAWTANELPADAPPVPQTPVAEGVAGGYGADSISAARVAGSTLGSGRTMEDARINLLPFIPPSWNEAIVRFALPGKQSINQRLSTSSLASVRNAHNVLLRSSLATAENQKGVANAVPIEVAVGQRAGDLYTKLVEVDEDLRGQWWKKVEGGTYDREEILTELKRLDPNLPADYQLNRTTFDKLLKAYMADSTTIGSRMDEVTQRVDLAAKQRDQLDADKIDNGLYEDKSQLIDIATGQRVLKPEETPDGLAIERLQREHKDLEMEVMSLKALKKSDDEIEARTKRMREVTEEIKTRREALKAYEDEFNAITPTSKTHRFAYEDGSHYLSRAFDKGRITGDREGFQRALMDGWLARNPTIDPNDPRTAFDLQAMARAVTNKLLNEDDTVTLGELKQNFDLPGNYTKGRTLNLDDRFLLSWTSDDVLATEMYHLSQSVVDVELAKAGIRFNDLIEDINREFQQKTKELNAKYGTGTKAAKNAISALAKEHAKNKEDLTFAIRRLKRKGPTGLDSSQKLLNAWTSRINKVAGMAQLGSSAIPNSIPDLASVARSFGTGRTLKLVARAFNPSDYADMKTHAKQLGVLSELIDTQMRELTVSDALNGSMDPNRHFRSTLAQRFDHGLDWTVDKFGKVALIDGWARVGRMVASVASAQRVLDLADKGWDALDATTRADLAKFYIDADMLQRIRTQAKQHGTDMSGVRFAELDQWDDLEAAQVFKASTFAQTEAALNIPSIGTGSSFISENFIGRMYNRFQSFNNAAYESTFLQSLQNRDVTRIAIGTANYAFWGFVSVWAYDTITGRDNSIDKYFGSAEAMQLTAWKMLIKGGFIASPSDNFAGLAKALGNDWNPVNESFKDLFPGGLTEELFPKYDDVSFLQKVAGPSWGYVTNAGEAAGKVIGDLGTEGELDEKTIGKLRNLIPGQNIGWLRRGIDYLEEALGGRPSDRNAGK
jgi:hypothetical protein